MWQILLMPFIQLVMRGEMNNMMISLMLLLFAAGCLTGGEGTKYVRCLFQGRESYGILTGDMIKELDGDIFSS